MYQPSSAATQPTYHILFDESKTTSLPVKKLRRALQLRNISTSTSRHNISTYTLSDARVYVLYDPQQPLTIDEFAAVKHFLSNPVNALVIFLAEGGEAKNQTNVNYILEEFGIIANNDAVIRQTFHKYTHPKECLIDTVGPPQGSAAVPVLYPFGCSLNVQAPAETLLTSGLTAYPVNRPVVAISEGSHGRVLVVGSSEIFADKYIDYEQNLNYALYLFEVLLGKKKIEKIVQEGEIHEYNYLPNIAKTSEMLRPCLIEPPRVPVDVDTLSKRTLFEYGPKQLPEIVKILDKVEGIKFQPLTLIQPKFNVPLPELKPAVFPATLEDFGGPPLELFDLDDAFMPAKNRLAQLANQCGDKDVDFFVGEAGKILGIKGSKSGDILKHVLLTVADFKKFKYHC
jgi:intraflagellar transport protein 52